MIAFVDFAITLGQDKPTPDGIYSMWTAVIYDSKHNEIILIA